MRVEHPQDLVFTGQRTEAGTHLVQMISTQGPEPLPMRPDLASHSSTGFDWGYAGQGPAQLALAICAAIMSNTRARATYERVEVKLIARINADRWTLTAAQVLAVARGHARLPLASGLLGVDVAPGAQ